MKDSYSCDLSLNNISDININFGHAYSMMSSSGQTHSEKIEIRNNGEACNYFITFDTISGLSRKLAGNNGFSLPYEILDSIQHNTPIMNLANTNSSNIFSGNAVKNQVIIHERYYVLVPYTQNIPAGMYRDTALVSIYEGNLSNYVLRDTKEMNIHVYVAARVNIAIYASRGSQNNAILDFGTIRIGDTHSFTVEVEKNIPYDLSISSENSGYLAHHSIKNKSTIPYILELNGKTINLANSTSIVFEKMPRGHIIDAHQFNITIDDYDFVVRGKYRDSLVFTVSAR